MIWWQGTDTGKLPVVTISLVSKQVGRGTHTLQVYNFQTDLRIFFFVAVTWKFYQLSEDPKCKSHPQIIELSLEPTKNPFFVQYSWVRSLLKWGGGEG